MPRPKLVIEMRFIACVLGAGLLAWSVPAVSGPVGMDRAKLDGVRDVLAARRTKSFLVVHNGEIVYDWYAPGHDPTRATTSPRRRRR